MDEQLAAIYGTGQQYSDDDIEKTAAAELLVKLAEEEGVDLDQFSDEEIAGMIGEFYGEDGSDDTGEISDEGGEEKVAEADMLGRVMAHAMVQELGEIEKEAGAKLDAVKGGARKAWDATKGGAGKAWKSTKEYHKKGVEDVRSGFARAKGPVQEGQKGRGGPSLLERAKMVGKGSARFAPHAAGGGIAAGAAGAAMNKKGSAIDKLAEARAYELLEEAGYELPEQEKVAGDLDTAVETRALQMLESAGYPVEWSE